jgi:Ferritin-like domain
MTFPLLAAGCKGVRALGTPPTPLPDVAVLNHAISAEKLMIARYRAAVSGSPGQAGLLGALLAQHEAHLARLTSRLIDPGATGRARPPSPAATPPASAIDALRAAEQDAANALVGHLTEVSPSLAQLLASIAASEASHALLLGSRGGTG